MASPLPPYSPLMGVDGGQEGYAEFAGGLGHALQEVVGHPCAADETGDGAATQ